MLTIQYANFMLKKKLNVKINGQNVKIKTQKKPHNYNVAESIGMKGIQALTIF
jgi:hypothetical protein